MTTIEAVVAAGDLRTVVRTGDAALAGEAALAGDGAYHRVGAASVNDAGDVAFVASLAGSVGAQEIVCVRGGRAATLVSTVDGRFASFGELDLGDGGYLLFRATLAGGGSGVYLHGPGGIEEIAVSGGLSPRGHRYRSFESLTLAATRTPAGPYYRLAFVAGLADGRRSLVIRPSYTAAAEVLTTGQSLGEDVVEDIAISPVGLSVACVVTLRRAGRTIVLAHEGALSWGGGVAEGATVGGLPAITRILAPPGCHFELAFTAVSLTGGRGALLCQPAMDDTRVLAQTGDPAPGLPGFALSAFGPPVASCGLPLRQPFGVASPVRLSDGRSAIWLATLPTAASLAGHTALPVLEGEVTHDSRRLQVSHPVPVKLTNTGTLLVRAWLGPPDNRREGLLLISDLLSDN